MGKRIYICHTYYHVYIACLKECSGQYPDKADVLLSTMSNDFGDLKERINSTELFGTAYQYEEQPEVAFPQLAKYHVDRGNLFINMLTRIRYTKLFGKLEAPFIPVSLKEYQDIYVFCDSDPIGYYLNYAHIPYHAVEDGLDCIRYYDTARYDNRGHFNLKARLSAMNLIFIQNGWGKYCLDMEVNDISVLEYPCPKYIEQNREELVEQLSMQDKDSILHLFMENIDAIQIQIGAKQEQKKIFILTEPLCDLTTREQIFKDIIAEYGNDALCILKPHPRDVLDYKKLFSDCVVIEGKFPMEILNFIPGLTVDKVISVFTVPSSIHFAKETVFLGEDFMDRYEAPEIHRQNEQI